MRRKHLFTSKAGILIFLALNLFVMIQTLGVRVGGMTFLLSVFAAASPFGESILRLYRHTRRINDPQQLSRIEPLYYEVLQKARAADHTLPSKIEIMLLDSDNLRVEAIGQKTIALNAAAIKSNPDALRAKIAHELGHISARDPLWVTMAYACNIYVVLILLILEGVLMLFNAASGAGGRGGRMFGRRRGGFGRRIFGFIIGLLYRVTTGIRTLWNRVMRLLINWSLKEDELFADEFVYNMGYEKELRQVIEHDRRQSGNLVEQIMSPYISPETRIEHLDSLAERTQEE